MAVVKGNYIRRGKVGNNRAKDAIRYMQHRPGHEGAKITRRLFGPDGPQQREHAYLMIDEAPKGILFYRMSLNPDPKREDTNKDLDLRELTERTIRTLEQIVKQQVYYVAAIHADHRDRRHVYLLASVHRRLNTPELERLRDAATQVCREQRQERDLLLAREREDWEREPELEEDTWER
jgi:hypothetical protein